MNQDHSRVNLKNLRTASHVWPGRKFSPENGENPHKKHRGKDNPQKGCRNHAADDPGADGPLAGSPGP